MAIPLTVNGAVFEYPVDFDESWGVDATGWAQAVTNGMLQMAGGSFPLTADVNFGPNFGLLAQYFKSRSANPATVGTVRLSSADAGIAFRNNANSANLIITTDSSNRLLYNGNPIASSSGSVTSIIATANQTTVSAATGDVTIGTVQSIGTVSSPTFAGLTLSSPLSVANGGTGDSTLTAYAVLCGGTTSTNPVQSIAGVGTTGQVLTSNGPGTLPTFQGSTSGITSLTGTASQVLVNGTSGSPQTGAITLTTPQNLSTASTPTFTGLSANGAKITSMAQGTVTGDGIAFPVASAQISSNTVTGSTANSAGSAGNIAQGTVSTPDLRANAVTQIVTSASTGLPFGSLGAAADLVTSASITTTGGKVFISALYSAIGTGTGPLSLSVFNGTTTIPGNYGNYPPRTGASYSGGTITCVDAPVAGTYTYNFYKNDGTSGLPATTVYSLTLIEVKK